MTTIKDWDLEVEARFEHWEEDASWFFDDDIDGDLDFRECEE